MYFLTEELYFPPVSTADRHGLLAIGGDLSPNRLMLAYQSGIFPWFSDDEPILWWAPPMRMVVFPDQFKPSKSMRNILNRRIFKVTFNQDFNGVISNCRSVSRKDQDDTWITPEMIEAYCKLYEMGKAQSVEVWQDDQLVGGLYGVDQGHVFSGESMFSKVPNASKVAFISLVNHLRGNGYKLLDCQLHNDHLASLGAREISREEYMAILKNS
jgi:leucyl/phenylalanyl-tRNA--protein transferase